MSDVGQAWELVRPFHEGGQAHTFIVKRKGKIDDHEYVLKRLKDGFCQPPD